MGRRILHDKHDCDVQFATAPPSQALLCQAITVASTLLECRQEDYEFMKISNRARSRKRGGKIRYAVVGLGHIAQYAVLPAFENARENSVLAALISDDPAKLD